MNLEDGPRYKVDVTKDGYGNDMSGRAPSVKLSNNIDWIRDIDDGWINQAHVVRLRYERRGHVYYALADMITGDTYEVLMSTSEIEVREFIEFTAFEMAGEE